MNQSGRRVVSSALVVVVAILVVTAVPVEAQANDLASIHTTDTDFSNADTLNNVTVAGSGTSASADLDTQPFSYNVVNDGGDGTTDTTSQLVGDTFSNNAMSTELKTVPDFTGEVDTLTLDISTTMAGSDYGFTVDIYAVQEDPDGTTGEGTLIRSGWDPDFSGGTQTITLDTNFIVQNGETWTLEFVSQSTDSDSESDWIAIKSDSSFSSNWYWNSDEGFREEGGDLTLSADSSYNTGTYISQNHSADKVEKGFVNLSLTDANATVTWEYWDGSSWTTQDQTTYTSGGNKTVSWATQGTSKWRVNVTFEASTGGVVTATVEDEGVLFESSEPSLDNSSASPNGTIINSDTITLEIDLNDTDFGTSQGDSVDVTFQVEENGTSGFKDVGTDTLTSNGTASVSYQPSNGGISIWRAVATDSYGNTNTSHNATFEVPSVVTIRNESNASQIIKSPTTVHVTIFSQDQVTVLEKDVSDGNVSLAGVPVTEPVVLLFDADGFYVRTFYVEDVFEQQNAYLLNKTEYPDAKTIEFQLDDRTGSFPSENSTIRIQRAVNLSANNNTLVWETVDGDVFDAAGGHFAILQNDTRYRIIIENEQGDRRNLGPYLVQESRVETLVLGRVSWPQVNGTSTYYRANITYQPVGTDTAPVIAIKYFDPANNTTNFDVSVYERDNQSNEIYTDSVTGNVSKYFAEVNTTTSEAENTSWVVEINYEYQSESHTQKRVVGVQTTDFPIDPDFLSGVFMVGIPILMGLYGPRNWQYGLVMVFGFIGVGMMLQWVNIPIAAYATGLIVLTGGILKTEATRT